MLPASGVRLLRVRAPECDAMRGPCVARYIPTLAGSSIRNFCRQSTSLERVQRSAFTMPIRCLLSDFSVPCVCLCVRVCRAASRCRYTLHIHTCNAKYRRRHSPCHILKSHSTFRRIRHTESCWRESRSKQSHIHSVCAINVLTQLPHLTMPASVSILLLQIALFSSEQIEMNQFGMVSTRYRFRKR